MKSRLSPGVFACPLAFALLGIATLTSLSSAQAADITTIASFTGAGPGTNGQFPLGPLTLDGNGNLFGTTSYGGPSGQGTVFEIAAGSTTVTTLAEFVNLPNGTNPAGALALNSQGNLYGTTQNGGSPGGGTVWEIAAGSTTITTIASFGYNPGGNTPIGGVTIDSQGNLYGTASAGGANSAGTVWKIAHGSTTLITLAAFNGVNGDCPTAGVTLDSHGNLFGTTEWGGTGPNGGEGTVWEIVHGTNIIITLVSFNGTNGSLPYAGVTFNSKGDLFGTTQRGLSGYDGRVWEIVAGSTTLTTFAAFNNTNGNGTAGGVTFDSSGNIFGTAGGGDPNNDGTVWEIVHGTSTITTIAKFNFTNGFNPATGVTLDHNGNLFGTTFGGGSVISSLGYGVVFEVSGAATPPAPYTHLLWNHTSDGQASLWTVYADGSHASVQYGPFFGWSAKAVSDAPDGSANLLWTNTNGQASLWNVTSGGYTDTFYGPYAGWTATGLATGPDGVTRLLWDKTDGTASLWTLVGNVFGSFTHTEYGPLPGRTAKAIASGPTTTDLLWTATDGSASVWNVTANGYTDTGYGPYPGWGASALAVGPDDGGHLLWDNADGQASLWALTGDIFGTFTPVQYGPFPDYAARAIATGPDNVTHILWNKPDGTASLWAVTGSGYTYATYGPFAGWTAVALSAGP